MGAIGTELFIIFILTLANGFFAASEIGIVSARRSRLEQQANAGSNPAKQAMALADNPDRFLATVQVGITLIGTFSAAFGGARIGNALAAWFGTMPAVAAYAEPLGLGIVVVSLTYLSLIVGELVPKRLALQHAERMATISAPIMAMIAMVARPMIAFLTFSVQAVLRLLGQSQAQDESVTQEDIEYLVREGVASGSVEAGEAHFVQSMFRFRDRAVRAVMTPRTELVAVPTTATFQDVIGVFTRSGYSRLPVYQETLDQIVGVLHAKDMLEACQSNNSADILNIMRTPAFVLETHHVDDLLPIFRHQGTHLAIVVDEYGQVAGLITLEDVLEELVGEIQDEHDIVNEQAIIQREDGSWLVDGLLPYDQVQRQLALPPIPDDERGEYTTLAGLLLARLQAIPRPGDAIHIEGFFLEVVDMDGRRIDKVLVQKQAPKADS